MPSQQRSSSSASRRQRGYPTASEIRGRNTRALEESVPPCTEQDRVMRLTPLRGFSEMEEPIAASNTTPTRSSQSKQTPVCHFFAMNGSCRNGYNCAFSHDVIPGDTRSVPCSFFLKGNCRYGDACRFSHDVSSEAGNEEATSPAVCHPCTVSPADNDEEEELVCGICMEHPTKFGLLSGCDHVFCFTCLMEWRSSSCDSEQKSLVKVCPICRTHSDYVLSSFTYAKTGQGKQDLMEAHKVRLSQIPCKRFNGELGSCPFGKDCFYQHADEYGADVKQFDLSMQEIQEELEHRKRRRQHHLASRRSLFDAEMEMLEAQLALLQLGLASFAFQLDI